MIWTIIGGLFLLVLGIAAFLWPKTVWEITERWKINGEGEPSDFYLTFTKYGGLLLALLGLAGVRGAALILRGGLAVAAAARESQKHRERQQHAEKLLHCKPPKNIVSSGAHSSFSWFVSKP